MSFPISFFRSHWPPDDTFAYTVAVGTSADQHTPLHITDVAPIKPHEGQLSAHSNGGSRVLLLSDRYKFKSLEALWTLLRLGPSGMYEWHVQVRVQKRWNYRPSQLSNVKQVLPPPAGKPSTPRSNLLFLYQLYWGITDNYKLHIKGLQTNHLKYSVK